MIFLLLFVLFYYSDDELEAHRQRMGLLSAAIIELFLFDMPGAIYFWTQVWM